MNTKNYTQEEIAKIMYVMSWKIEDWLLSGGLYSDGIEVYKTSDNDIHIVKDIETGFKIGMRKDITNDGVIADISFFKLNGSEEFEVLEKITKLQF